MRTSRAFVDAQPGTWGERQPVADIEVRGPYGSAKNMIMPFSSSFDPGHVHNWL
jgi:hypothetical protein